jgi:hypothetical protein
MKTFQVIVFLLFVFSTINSKGQNGAKTFDFDGYLSAMPQYMWSDTLEYKQALLHNRLNFSWYPIENITVTAQFRNQLLYGDFVEMGNFDDGFVTENYFLPLTFQQTFDKKSMLYVSADRLFAEYTKNKLEIKLGRQRINWGQTFVWNPNDIFNTYNFFDFDYAERPGADAIRIQYYTNATSQIDVAAKIDSGNNITAAAIYRANKWNIDFQFMGGYYSQPHQSILPSQQIETDWILGMALTGDFKGISLRSETSYLYPTEDSPIQDDLFLLSTGLDYTFSSSLTTSAEFLYSSKISLVAGSSLLGIYSGPMTIKNMAYAKYSFFAQAAYPITPLLNTSISGMYFTDDIINGYYAGPSLNYSLGDNLELAGFYQYFRFVIEIPGLLDKTTTSINIAFLRLKWNF